MQTFANTPFAFSRSQSVSGEFAKACSAFISQCPATSSVVTGLQPPRAVKPSTSTSETGFTVGPPIDGHTTSHQCRSGSDRGKIRKFELMDRGAPIWKITRPNDPSAHGRPGARCCAWTPTARENPSAMVLVMAKTEPGSGHCGMGPNPDGRPTMRPGPIHTAKGATRLREPGVSLSVRRPAAAPRLPP